MAVKKKSEGGRPRRKTHTEERPNRKAASKPKTTEAPKTVSLFAVIRVRGTVNISKNIKDTTEMLRLRRTNNCVLVPDNPVFKGMLRRAQNFLTWGEIDHETLEKLIWKRGRLQGDMRLEKTQVRSIVQKIIKDSSLKNAGIKPVFRLTPPSKGHKPIRMLYPKGACGYRGKDVNDLLKRMI